MSSWDLMVLLTTMPSNGLRYSLPISLSIVLPDVSVEGVFPTEMFATNGAGVPRLQVHLCDVAGNALLVHEHTTSHPLTIKLGSVVTRDSVVIPQVGREHMSENWQVTACVTDDPGACVRFLRCVINQLLSVLTKCELKVSYIPMKITWSVQE